ncbi:MAG: YCF48-related protein, partial [Bacteroidota bacterium]
YTENLSDWEDWFPGDRRNLQTIQMQESGIGIILGNNSAYYRTEDYGTTWEGNPDWQGTIYEAAWMGDEVLVTNTFGAIFTSTDAGMTSAQSLLLPGAFFSDFDLVNEQTARLVSNKGQLIQTFDQGETWAVDTLDGAPDLRAIGHFTEDIWIIAGGNGLILRSIDQGGTWEQIESGLNLQLKTIEIIDETTAFILPGASSGSILHTTDAGVTWNPIDLPLFNFWEQLDFSNPDRYYLAGGSYGGYLLISEDQGLSWEVDLQEITAYSGIQTVYNPDFELEVSWLIGRGNSIQYKIHGTIEEPNATKEPQGSDVAVFPNPVIEVLHLEGLKGEGLYQIFDRQGRLWYFGMLQSATEEVDVAQLPSGMYIIRVQGEGKPQVIPWIKQ